MSQIGDYQSSYAYDQMRAHKAKQAHMRNAKHEPIPVFPADSAEALSCQYSKPEVVQPDPARRELAGLIAASNEAAAVALAKKNALSRAVVTVTNLRGELDAARKVAADQAAAQAKALAASFENDTAPPAPANTVTTMYLDEFQQKLDVATGAKDRLQADVTEADAELNKRQAQVVAAAFAVMRGDGDRIAGEIQTLQAQVDALRLHIGTLDRFGGGFVVKVGDATKLERPQLLTARSIATIERPPEPQYPATQNPRVEIAERWKAYHSALCLSADAQLDS